MKPLAHGLPGRSLRRSRASRAGRGSGAPAMPMPVLIAYGDIPAARNAMMRLTQQLRLSSTECQLQPMLWRFDQFAHRPWREQALRDARRARAVVLALSETGALTSPAEAWLAELAADQCGAPVHVLALLGPDEAWTISLQKTAAPPRRRPPPAAPRIEPLVLPPAAKQVAA